MNRAQMIKVIAWNWTWTIRAVALMSNDGFVRQHLNEVAQNYTLVLEVGYGK